jgi:protein-tyrosine phosphatase
VAKQVTHGYAPIVIDLDLTWITEDLAIGGAFLPTAIPVLAREHRIRAVVDLRAEQCDDRALLAGHQIRLLHLPTLDHHPIEDLMLARGIAFIAEQLVVGARVLVHCQYGIGRSVLLVLCALVERGMAPLDALTLAKQRRSCVSPSLAQYRAWSSWLEARGVAAPSFDDFARVAYARVS